MCGRVVEEWIFARHERCRAAYTDAVMHAVVSATSLDAGTATKLEGGVMQLLRVLLDAPLREKVAVLQPHTAYGRTHAAERERLVQFERTAAEEEAALVARTAAQGTLQRCRGCRKSEGVELLRTDQTRGNDEAETEYYRCTLCGEKWSVNN
jgi:DNA-directed RNA polymerase subunit M/transcription elongation factor TFIIS